MAALPLERSVRRISGVYDQTEATEKLPISSATQLMLFIHITSLTTSHFIGRHDYKAVGRRSAPSIELQSVNLEIGVKLAKFQLTYQHENDISHGKWFQYNPICSRAVGKKYTVWHRPLCKQFPVSRAPAR